MNKFSQVTAIILFLAMAINLEINSQLPAIAYSVCGTKREAAAFKTKSYLITICPGEASFQLILTYHDGTGYKRISVQKEGNKYRGSDGKNNYIIDRNYRSKSIDYWNRWRRSHQRSGNRSQKIKIYWNVKAAESKIFRKISQM